MKCSVMCSFIIIIITIIFLILKAVTFNSVMQKRRQRN